jgi:hypothetical protein
MPLSWNSDIRIKNNYGAAKELAVIMEVGQGGESPVYLVYMEQRVTPSSLAVL